MLVLALAAVLVCAWVPGARAAVSVPAGVVAVLDAGVNRAVSVTWEHEDGVLFWNVERSCSASDTGGGATVIRVTEARLVDFRRAFNETCSYRIAACDLDGCSGLVCVL